MGYTLRTVKTAVGFKRFGVSGWVVPATGSPKRGFLQTNPVPLEKFTNRHEKGRGAPGEGD
jgi:hypothetical protein